MDTTKQQFCDAIANAGMSPPEVIEADGKLRRFASNGKRGDDAGWYLLHDDGIPAGSFGDWRTGFTQTWRADIDRKLTNAEEEAHREKVATMRREREAEEARGHAEAATKAAKLWNTAQPAPDDHSYLTRKGIKASGARIHNGALVIPMRTDGVLHSLQFIDADGGKKFLSGGRVSGCYVSIGTMKDAAALCVAEGFATGATIREATGYPVAVAFNAGNLSTVAKAMRAKFPGLPLILCADDDYKTDDNPGLTKATEAARFVGGLLAIPDFGANRTDKATDFNDMAALQGLEAVRNTIGATLESGNTFTPPEVENAATGDAAALSDTETRKQEADGVMPENGVSEVSEVQACNDGLSADTPADTAGVSEVTGESIIPDESKRPCFKVFDDWQPLPDGKLKPGVWFFTIKHGKGEAPPALIQQWICSPLHIQAVTFDGQDNNFGRMLRFKTTVGKWREWAMPMELLRGAGDELRGELLAMGVEIDPQAGRNLLARYLQDKPPKRRIHCALQVGWCGDSFVLPDTVIGAAASGVIFQSGERGHDEFTKAGTLAGWQAEISARAVGNPLLTLALAASFAGAMLARCNGESGGIHYVGDSSTGKTTAIEAACSTWGGANYRRSWRATSNGMEGAASLFNDGLLALDEISECDPREVGAIIYALGNGRGKQRASRTGNARGVTRWRCFVLSSGERTIATAMMEGGAKAKAGQSVRLLDIPAARRFGAWDNLHGLPSGTAFSDAIKRAAVTHHGHAGRAFLEKLTRDKRNFGEYLERIKLLPGLSADGGEGQSKRAAGRFAMLALAGEVATEYGITGWQEGAAIEAAAVGFKAWQSTRGRGNDERRQILDRVSGFIERHGDSRFSNADTSETSDTMRVNRAGWWRDAHEGRAYLFTAEGLREALTGFDFNRALDALQEAGALPIPGADGKRAKFYRIGGRGVKLYPVQADKLGGDHGA
jgi:putative DNA primase/helicase